VQLLKIGSQTTKLSFFHQKQWLMQKNARKKVMNALIGIFVKNRCKKSSQHATRRQF
jgi:hypothetical protein